MAEAALKWFEDGWSLPTFHANHGIAAKAWARILRESPEIKAIRDIYLAKLPYYRHRKNTPERNGI
jgi:hypothetical protein